MKDGKHQTLKEISSEVETYFRGLSYNKQRIRFYQKGWSVIEQFMEENSIEFYEAKVGDAFISKIQGTSVTTQNLAGEKKI